MNKNLLWLACAGLMAACAPAVTGPRLPPIRAWHPGW